jgi:hypothetical protein
MLTQSNLSILNTPPYLDIANRIAEELNARGFTTDTPSQAVNLVERISEIIRNGIEGNLVVKVDDGMDELFKDIPEYDESIIEELKWIANSNGWKSQMNEE